jgi:hypothetical protein
MPATTRIELLKQGVPRSTIDRRIVSGVLLPVHAGVFACDSTWESQLAAHLLRGGRLSAASHRAAARLHGFDGFTNPIDPSAPAGNLPDLDITVPKASTFRSAPAVRSTSLDEGDVVRIGSFRVTSVVRTLMDLGRFLTVDQLEIATESAFRGSDPRRPDLWNESVLDELVARMALLPRGLGIANMRDALARRPVGARPTGSYVETVGLQGLRLAGLGMQVLRQPTVQIFDPKLGIDGRWFPDVFDVGGGLDTEYDGEEGHASLEGRRRDAKRDRTLGNYFRVARYTGADVLADPRGVGASIATIVHERRETTWQTAGVRYSVEGNLVVIRRD